MSFNGSMEKMMGVGVLTKWGMGMKLEFVKTLGRDRTWLAREYPLRREMGGG